MKTPTVIRFDANIIKQWAKRPPQDRLLVAPRPCGSAGGQVMGRWLSKIQKSTSQPPYKTYESPSVGSVGTSPGAFEENHAPGPLTDIDHIINVLTQQAGRDLGPELARRMRHIMAPMNRKDRAELAAALDDAFEVAPSVGAARWQCHRLLSDAKALAEAKAAWPGYPSGST